MKTYKIAYQNRMKKNKGLLTTSSFGLLFL
jgi:hypothetical protein